jgi:hypothetical protein
MFEKFNVEVMYVIELIRLKLKDGTNVQMVREEVAGRGS